MKKYISFFAFAALTAVVISCQASLVEEDPGITEEVTPQEELILQTYTATTGAVTKTAMDSGNTVWAPGDEIKVYYTDASSSSVGISDGVGTRTGVFSGMVPGGKTGAYAVYPAANTSSVDIANRKVTVTIPAEQTLDATTGGFTTGNIATSIVDAGNNLQFQNVNAFLSVTVSDAVTKVVVESVDGTALASDIEVTYPEDPADPVTYSNSGTEYDSITLLLPGAAGTYYFSVVPGTHAKGLKFTYYTGSYTETGTYYLNKSLTIARNDNWQFGAFEPTKDYFVKASGSGGNGLSWSSALTPTQMWNMITLAAAGDDSDKKAALFDAIDGATFHLGAGEYNFGAAAALAVDEASTLHLTIKGGYPAAGGARDLANNTTTFTGDDDSDGTGDHRLLILNGNMNVEFDGITFTKGLTSGDGDARFGGGIWIKAGSHSFVDCSFTSNSAVYGGAIRFDSTGDPTPSLTLTRTTFSNNTASADAGALSTKDGETTIQNCSFTYNSAPTGGAIDCFSTSTVKILGGSFSYNSATSNGGGAIAVEETSTLEVNTSGSATTNFTYNSAAKDGGAISVVGNGHVDVWKSSLRHNDANDRGGAISAVGGVILKVYSSFFKQNHAPTGGAVYTTKQTIKKKDYYPVFYVDECSFEGNYITNLNGCTFNIDAVDEFVMYNSSVKDSYTKSTTSENLAGAAPCWIAIDGVNTSASLANCSIIGDTWDGNNNEALTDNTAIIVIWEKTKTIYFTNCIIVPESSIDIKTIRGYNDSYKAIIDRIYTHSGNFGNYINTNTDSGGNTTGHTIGDFGSAETHFNWTDNCWKWNGNIKIDDSYINTYSKATKDGVYSRVNSVCSDFVTWSGAAFYKDQVRGSRGDGDWWPGAYQN